MLQEDKVDYLSSIQNDVFFFFFFDEQGYVDLLDYLNISMDVYSFSISHIPGYYKDKCHGGGPKMLARNFKPSIS